MTENLHLFTQNQRGAMHPISELSQQFVAFAATANAPVVDIGCAYGNTVIAALRAGAKEVIACDMERAHLDDVQEQVYDTPYATHVTVKLGIFPDEIDFAEHSLAAIHASHLFPYLTGEEVELGLSQCYRWLQHGGKLFILTYTIHILELDNEQFHQEYTQRIKAGMKWPGYFIDFNKYSNQAPVDYVPKTLHFFDKEHFVTAIKQAGFVIEHAEYLDGKTNGAMADTWHDGREYLAIVARKI
jgi:SAM-dependent methyltransferase